MLNKYQKFIGKTIEIERKFQVMTMGDGPDDPAYEEFKSILDKVIIDDPVVKEIESLGNRVRYHLFGHFFTMDMNPDRINVHFDYGSDEDESANLDRKTVTITNIDIG